MPYTTEQKRLRAERLRSEWIDANGPCVRCGSVVDLEVDHIDPSMKSFDVSFSMGRAKLMAELEKCQVLCHVCHLEKTVAERSTKCKRGHDLVGENRQPHSGGGYRCRICQREHNRLYMQRSRGRSD